MMIYVFLTIYVILNLCVLIVFFEARNLEVKTAEVNGRPAPPVTLTVGDMVFVILFPLSLFAPLWWSICWFFWRMVALDLWGKFGQLIYRLLSLQIWSKVVIKVDRDRG